jgi:hypothetical protein
VAACYKLWEKISSLIRHWLNCSSVKVSVFTADKKGVTTVFKDTTGSSTVLPLADPELIVEATPLREFAKRIARQKSQLKRYIAIVAEGESMGKRSNKESSRNSQQSSKSAKFVKAVSYPVSIEELKENFAGLN